MKRALREIFILVLIASAVLVVREYFTIQAVKDCLNEEDDAKTCLESAKELLYYRAEYVKEVLSKVIIMDKDGEYIQMVIFEAKDNGLEPSHFMYEYREVIDSGGDYELKFKIAYALGDATAVNKSLGALLVAASRGDVEVDYCSVYSLIDGNMWPSIEIELKQAIGRGCIPKVSDLEQKVVMAKLCEMLDSDLQALHQVEIDRLRSANEFTAAFEYAKQSNVLYVSTGVDIPLSFKAEFLAAESLAEAVGWVQSWPGYIKESKLDDYDRQFVMLVEAARLYQEGKVKDSSVILQKYNLDVMQMHQLLEREDGFKYLKSLYYTKKLVQG